MELIKVKAERVKAKGLARRKPYCRSIVVIRCFKCLSLLLLLTATATVSRAQTFDEWFRQNSTQIKYLGIQIGFLVIQDVAVNHGNSIWKAGLGAIGNFTGTELGLHTAYVSSLRAVDPVIKADPGVAQIGVMAAEIIAAWKELPGLNGLTGSERSYVGAVKNEVLAACDGDLAELDLVLGPGKVSMTDDERWMRLHRIWASMREADDFTRGFGARVRLLVGERLQELQGIQRLKAVYGAD